MTTLQTKIAGIGVGVMLIAIPLLASAHTGSLNGATTVTVDPGATIHFASIVNLDGGDSVDAILYSLDGTTFTCADTNDVENTTHHHISHAGTVSFDFAAPTTPATYNFTYKVADGDLCDSNLGSLQISPALTIVVNAPVVQFTLTVTDVGPGVTTPGTGSFASGTIVTLLPTPAANATFVGFSQDCTGNSCPLEITGNTNVTATYQCNDGFHADGATCIANTTDTGGGDTGGGSSNTASTDNGGGGGGGGWGGGCSTYANGDTPWWGAVPCSNNPVGVNGGLVLGASTGPACTPLFSSFVGFGKKNNSDDVKKLQTFLNAQINAGLTVNGIFDQATVDAVKAFQLKYWQDVLLPWKPYGLGDHEATGYVYKTTLRMINMLSCSSLNIPIPDLP